MATQLETQQTTSTANPQPPLQSWKRLSDQTAVKANHSLEAYTPINLAEMKAVALLKRVDTKYILPTRQLFQALINLKDHYRVLEVQGNQINRYHNLYFDTSNFELYHQHHNGQCDRYKVRRREYVDTRLLAQGQLGQQVDVHSQDEIGELGSAFNQISSDLKSLVDQRQQMIADIAHDLRTPLTVIDGYIEAMQDSVLEATPERLETIHKEVQHMKRLVTDLRTLSLTEAGQLSINPGWVAPQELLTQAEASYRLAAE